MMSSVWARVWRNAASNLGGVALNLVVGFFLMPFVVHHLGLSAFGVWALVNGLVGYVGLLDFGLGPTLVKKTAEFLAGDDPGREDTLSRTVSAIFFLYVAIGVLVLLSVGAVNALGAHLFNLDPANLREFRTVLWIVGVQVALSFPMSTWNGLLGGLQDFHVMNLVGALSTLCRAVATVVLLTMGFGLVTLVLLGLTLSLASWTTARWWVGRRLPALRIRPRNVRRADLPELFNFSGVMILWSIAGYVVHQMDRVLIGVFLPITAVTTYEVGARLNNYSRNILHSWLSTIMPAASHLDARNEVTGLQQLYVGATKYLLLSYCGLVLPLVGFGHGFMRLWMGPGFDTSARVMILLLLASLYQSQNVVAHVMLPGMGELRIFGRFMAVYPVVVLICQVSGLKAWGLLGVAGGTAAGMVVMETFFVFYVQRVFRLNIRTLLVDCHWRVLISAVAPVAWILAARSAAAVDSWPVFILDSAACVGLYAAGAWLGGLTRAEREACLNRMLAVRNRLRGEAALNASA